MGAIGRLVRAEFRGRRRRAMVLFAIVVALAAAALVAGLQGQSRAGDRWDAAFAEANGAHVTVDSPDPETLAAIARLPGVTSSTHVYRRSAADLEVLRDGGALTTTFVREMAGDDLSEVARPLVRDGRWVAPGAGDEIVIDRAFGLDERIEIGDQIAISTPSGAPTFTVVGRAVDLVDCLYPSCDPVTTWVDPAGFDRIGADATSLMFLRLSDPDTDDRFIAGLGDFGVGAQGWIDTRDDAVAVYAIFGAFLGAFGIFVMIAAAIVIAGSMATRAVARRRDIGLLKAVGATPRQVTLSIVLAHAAVAAVGVVAGWLLGGILTPVTQLDLGSTLGAGGAAFSVPSLIAALLAVEVIVGAATVVPAWRASRVPTTAALAPVLTHAGRGRLLGRVAGRLRVGPVGLAGVRDVFGRLARSALTAVALALAIVAVLTSIATERTIDQVFGDPALVGNPEELRVYPTGADGEAIAGVLDRNEHVASWFTETPQQLALGDETFLGLAMSGDLEHAGFDVRDGRMLAGSGEAVAGWGLLDRLGPRIGDELAVTAHGRALSFRIVGWYRESEDTGEVLRFPLTDLERVRPGIAPEWASLNVTDGSTPAEVAAELTDQLGGVGRVEVQTTEGSDEIDAFRLAFLIVSVLVVVVAVANLAATMLLAVRERSHDLGVLRAVGLTPAQVVAMLAAGSAVLAVGAAAIGVPLGLIAGEAVAGLVGSASGIGPGLGAGPGIIAVIVVVTGAVAVAALLGAVAARRAATAEVSDLVRYE